MGFKLEILPSDTSNFTPRTVKAFLARDCVFYAPNFQIINDDCLLTGFDGFIKIELDERHYYFYFFELEKWESSLEYIDNYQIFGKNINHQQIAHDWENIGFTLVLSAEDRLEKISSQSFKDISSTLVKTLNGTVWINDFIPNFENYALYDIQTWESFQLH